MWRFDPAAWSSCIATGYEGRQACIEKSHYIPEVKILDVTEGNVTVHYPLDKSKFPKLEAKGRYETNRYIFVGSLDWFSFCVNDMPPFLVIGNVRYSLNN